MSVSEEQLRDHCADRAGKLRHYGEPSALVWIDADLAQCDRFERSVRAIEDAPSDPDAERKEADRVVRSSASLAKQGLDGALEITIPGIRPTRS